MENDTDRARFLFHYPLSIIHSSLPFGGERVRGKRTVGQYRTIDLILFAAMLVVFESLAVLAARRWFPGEPYTVSVVPAVTAIVMMRWGPWAGIHAALGGAVFCLLSGARPAHYAIYIGGNLLSLAALAVIRGWTAEGIRESAGKSLLFALAVTALMQLGRAMVSLVFGAKLTAALGFFTTDTITMLFTLVLIWIVRRLDGLFEEQNHYLFRIHEQEKEERGGF